MSLNLGHLFFVIALILFLMSWVGAAVVPNPLSGGLFYLTLGLLLAGVPLSGRS